MKEILGRPVKAGEIEQGDLLWYIGEFRRVLKVSASSPEKNHTVLIVEGCGSTTRLVNENVFKGVSLHWD